ncbi:SRPBCC family protein [Bradyrhizobium sp.]|uniref:SRPBCC family protein n=1 Tax=Bradyrhizobium sp. TaxID=376 RepID=UPI00262FD5C3|nr:SRPBCC family protein [Bradyrhizobium sp.]
MNLTIQPAAIRKSFTVKARPEKAWEVFTAGFGRWWPKTHYIGNSPLSDAAIEPRAGGRWYGIHEDGVERPWGQVKVWEPPKRLLLDWQISHEWGYRSDLHTDVEILFTAVGEAETRIDFEHRGLEAFGDSEAAANTRAGMDRGWGLILEGFKAAVEA